MAKLHVTVGSGKVRIGPDGRHRAKSGTRRVKVDLDEYTATRGDHEAIAVLATQGTIVRNAVEFIELGPVMMKGIPDPIDLYRVERVLAREP